MMFAPKNFVPYKKKMEEVEQNIIVTVDVAMFSVSPAGRLAVLLPVRPREPFAGVAALPGVYIRKEDASAEAAARRALVEKAGVTSPYLEQLATFSGPARDPRGWAVSVAYYALVPWGVLGEAAQMVEVADIPRLPFDHNEIIAAALARLRGKATYSELPLHLMPEHFTLAELQDVYEHVMGEEISRTLFRKRMVEGGLIIETGEMSRGGAHRPAALFRRGQSAIIAPIPALGAKPRKGEA
jgi:8-oxo-dGTP diphosphatase